MNSEAELDELLTRPRPVLTEFIRQVSSPLLLVGSGGKMGPTLAVLAKRAAEAAGHPLEVVAASRFANGEVREWLDAQGIRTLVCDLIDPRAVEALPDSSHIVYLAGLKFGTSRNPSATWAVNTLAPARVCERFPGARIVALSTGNVYPFRSLAEGAAPEASPLTPIGEYANAAVARERIFEFCSSRSGTAVALMRLFYAVELRYGVLVDIALQLLQRKPVSLANSHFNCIWQGDANESILRSLALAATPPTVWNLCIPRVFSVRDIAGRLASALGVPAAFEGTESDSALVGDSTALCARLGDPPTSIETMIDRVAHWVKRGGRYLGRPTHFEVRDGRY